MSCAAGPVTPRNLICVTFGDRRVQNSGQSLLRHADNTLNKKMGRFNPHFHFDRALNLVQATLERMATKHLSAETDEANGHELIFYLEEYLRKLMPVDQ